MNHPIIVGLGEVLWDIVPQENNRRTFGGAPANVACSAAALHPSARVAMASALGRDELGAEARGILEAKGVDTTCVQETARPTGQVQVVKDALGNASYTFEPDMAWDHLHCDDLWRDLAGQADAVCFGSLAQRSQPAATAIHAFLRATRPDCLRLFDVNLRPPFVSQEVVQASLKTANALKLNEEELPTLANWFSIEGEVEMQVATLAERFNLGTVILTLGPKGAVLQREGECHRVAPTDVPKNENGDSIGAGDCFAAACVLGTLAGDSLESIGTHAARAAAFVCSCKGATPSFPADLIRSP